MTQHWRPWPDDHVAHLREQFEAKKSICSMVISLEEKFGAIFTRNAVIGKLHRIGLKRVRTKAKPRPLPRAKVAVDEWKPRPVPTMPVRPIGEPVTLLELASHHCRFPLREGPADQVFCGAEPADGSSYCGYHASVCYRPGRT
jgi:hypothetical protein